MLRVILVAEPPPEQSEAVAAALESTPLTEVFAASGMLPPANRIASLHSLTATRDDRFDSGATALEAILGVAESTEGTIAVVAAPAVVREVIVHALDAPVPEDRLALDPGAIAEVEVRTDAPWTVNRINDACHLGLLG